MHDGIIALLGLAFSLILIPITIIKRKSQLGPKWSDFISAQVSINAKELSCLICNNNRFNKREGLINTALISLFKWNMWNYSATCFVCTECGHLHWFKKPNVTKVAAAKHTPID